MGYKQIFIIMKILCGKLINSLWWAWHIALNGNAMHCIALWYGALHCMMLYCIALWWIPLYTCITLLYIILYCIVLNCFSFSYLDFHITKSFMIVLEHLESIGTMLWCIALHYVDMHCIMWHCCIALHSTTLHYVVLHCVALYFI